MDFLSNPHGLLGWIMNISLHWEFPVFTSFIYVVWVLRNNKRIKEKKNKKEILRPKTPEASGCRPPHKKSLQLKSLIFLHNMGMSIFSMLVFKKTFEVVYTGFCTMPFRAFIADADRSMQKQLAPWIWVFYISKYYEIMDTYILFLSQKESSFLQMYHHAGAIPACWLVSLSESYSGWIWVVLNSFIHSAMYMYYAMTVVGVRPPFKRLITFMQITQFFVGLFFGAIYITSPDTFSPEPTLKMYQYSAIIFNVVYVIFLIGLFLNFERETYRKAVQKKAPAKVEKADPVSSVLMVESNTSSAVLSPS
ncbi:uncharacterized protein NEMAJ01_0634 [Nematocida major]|uniref:uncharacterized protein n=1 Tax=Nematocida major TaxID=1912982 RepID=UPI0020072515|nr:uncharacterized protein NEMAJ01_0634 [Nematocida major]KAH9385738.1 hypothetical protein NEMAJ01_0634 [Nematocida major]